LAAPDDFESLARLVGQDEHPLAQMWRSDAGCGKHAPLRIEPQRGQVSENVSESGRKETWDVLQEHEAGSHFTNHASDFRPQPPLVVLGFSSSGETDGLAGEPRRYEIHDSAPRSAIEGLEIVPDRRSIHGLVLHPRHEQGRGESVPLNEAHGSVGVSDGELEPEFQPSDSSA
jgi:hypothetical protein